MSAPKRAKTAAVKPFRAVILISGEPEGMSLNVIFHGGEEHHQLIADDCLYDSIHHILLQAAAIKSPEFECDGEFEMDTTFSEGTPADVELWPSDQACCPQLCKSTNLFYTLNKAK